MNTPERPCSHNRATVWIISERTGGRQSHYSGSNSGWGILASCNISLSVIRKFILRIHYCSWGTINNRAMKEQLITYIRARWSQTHVLNTSYSSIWIQSSRCICAGIYQSTSCTTLPLNPSLSICYWSWILQLPVGPSILVMFHVLNAGRFLDGPHPPYTSTSKSMMR